MINLKLQTTGEFYRRCHSDVNVISLIMGSLILKKTSDRSKIQLTY